MRALTVLEVVASAQLHCDLKGYKYTPGHLLDELHAFCSFCFDILVCYSCSYLVDFISGFGFPRRPHIEGHMEPRTQRTPQILRKNHSPRSEDHSPRSENLTFFTCAVLELYWQPTHTHGARYTPKTLSIPLSLSTMHVPT